METKEQLNERWQKDLEELKRCQENAKKNWPNGQKDIDEWYRLFRCEG